MYSVRVRVAIACPLTDSQRPRVLRIPWNTAMAAPIGAVEPIHRDTDNWTHYCERLAQYVVANGISQPAKQRAGLLSACGGGTYQLIRSLVFPAKPTDQRNCTVGTCPAPSSLYNVLSSCVVLNRTRRVYPSLWPN